jgi:hypothetical protein
MAWSQFSIPSYVYVSQNPSSKQALQSHWLNQPRAAHQRQQIRKRNRKTTKKWKQKNDKKNEIEKRQQISTW